MTAEHEAPRFAVLGNPVAHSLSPAMHRAAYETLGVTAHYDAIAVPAGQLAAFLDSDQGRVLDGASVTMPGKPEAHGLASEHDETSRLLGIANTLLRRADGTWRAENHDVHGIVATLQAHGHRNVPHGGILGSGATALSALLALSRCGAREVLISARSPERLLPHRELAARIGVQLNLIPWSRAVSLGECEVLVSALALPGAQALASAWAQEGKDAAVPELFFDVLYAPNPTPIGAVLRARGVRVASGLEMLAHQADMQIRSMLGVGAAPLEIMLAAAQAEQARRSG